MQNHVCAITLTFFSYLLLTLANKYLPVDDASSILDISLHVKYILSVGSIVSLFKKILYGKFENFDENFIFANSVKRHICDVENSQLAHDLPMSVYDRMISPISEGYIFTKLRTCEVSQKYNPRENF